MRDGRFRILGEAAARWHRLSERLVDVGLVDAAKVVDDVERVILKESVLHRALEAVRVRIARLAHLEQPLRDVEAADAPGRTG